MSGIEFASDERYVLPDDERFAYGGEQFQIKKHVWLPGHSVLHGALLHDRETGTNFFVLDADLARYHVRPSLPTLPE